MEYQKITKVSKNSEQNNSERVTNENHKKYLKKYIKKDIYIYKRETKIINNLDINITV